MYPSPAWDIAADAGYTITRTRWVLTEPPVFEIVVDIVTPIGTIFRTASYVRACEPHPLDGFATFGDGLWAVYRGVRTDAGYVDAMRDGVWSFYAGSTLIGTVAGTAGLLSNTP